MTVYVTADRRVVPFGHPDAVIGVAEVDIDAQGLREAYDEFIEESIKPKAKMLPKPADKAVRKHADK